MTEEDVRHVARLARLSLTDDEVEESRRELERVIEYMRVLDDVDVEGVAAAPYPFDMTMPARDDTPSAVEGAAPDDALLGNAPAAEDGQIVVPKVVE